MSALGDAIRAKIADGLLPMERPEKMYGSYGHEEPCSVCGALIQRSQVEWSFLKDDKAEYRFHLGCYAVWESVCSGRRIDAALQNRNLDL
jgi:hypothetical protein